MTVWRSMYVDSEKLGGGVDYQALRRAWVFVRPLRFRLLGYLLLVTATTGLAALPPLLFRRIIDNGVAHHDLAYVDLLALGCAGLFLLSAILTLAGAWVSRHIGQQVTVNLRAALFDHVQRMPIDFFTRVQTGRLASRLNNDVITSNGLFTDTLSSLVSDVLSLTFTVALMASLSWRLTLAILLLGPLMLVPSRLVGRTTRGLYKQQMQQWGEMNAVMQERFNVSGALLVKLFGRYRAELDSFTATSRRVGDTAIRLGVVMALFTAGMSLVGSIAMVLVYWLGARAVIGGSMTFGTLVALSAYVGRVFAPMLDLASMRINLVNGLVSFQRVFEVLDARHTITSRPDAARLSQATGEVEYRDVWFRYPAAAEFSVESLEPDHLQQDRDAPSDWILREVSFTAVAGTVTAIVGPSGSGKTTLCSLIPRLHDVTAGQVLLDGRDVREIELEDLAAAVGLVAQEPFLFHDTVLANLRYARPAATDEEIFAACRAARMHDLIETLPLGYQTMVGERGFRFSGGEKQRLAIARVLIKDPAIVILDEATSHLDTETEALVQEALNEAMRGRTAFVIAHRLSTIRAADQIMVLAGGQLVERGNHEELAGAGGVYANLHQM